MTHRAPRGSVLASDAHAGSTVLVTGGGTGIGRAAAIAFAQAGARVVICGRRAEALAVVQKEIEAADGECLTALCDIRDEDAVRALVSDVVARTGGIDVLVNNAGGQFMAPAEDITVGGWRAVHRLAVEATWQVTREVAVTSMIPRRRGVVVFIAFSPRRGIAGMVHATAARAAVENLAAGLALEWSRYGIRSFCVAPGTIRTEALEAQYDDAAVSDWAAAVPLGRLGDPDEVADVIAFLASAGGSYVTGTTVLVDGGADAWGAGRPAPATLPGSDLDVDPEGQR